MCCSCSKCKEARNRLSSIAVIEMEEEKRLGMSTFQTFIRGAGSYYREEKAQLRRQLRECEKGG